MSFTKEDRLLLSCSRVAMDDEHAATVGKMLQHRLDWDYIIKSSIRHGVAPLLRNSITRTLQSSAGVENQIPQRILEQFEKLYETSSRRNQRLYKIIGDIVREFDQAGVPVMGLKDVQLAKFVYHDPALRPMGDIDLLIHPEDYERAAECMFRLGFIREPFNEIPYTLKYAWGHHFRRQKDNIYVDLQWNVMQIEWDVYKEGSFDFEIERMWKNAEKIAIDEYHILVPRLEDMLFHLCLHLDGHHFSELILLCDIYEILKQYEDKLNWDYFCSTVKKHNAESFTYYPLILIHQLLQVDIPQEIISKIKPDYMRAGLMKNLFGNLTRLHHELDNIEKTVRPTPEIMQKLEAATRQQTAGAMKAYQEIDQIIRTVKMSGGSYILLDSDPAERLFAEPSLQAFGDFHLIVLANELPIVQNAFLSAGYTQASNVWHELLQKTVAFQSQDPTLLDIPTRINFESTLITEWEKLLPPTKQPTTQQVAMKLLKSKLKRKEENAANFDIRLNIIPVTPEQLLMYICYRTGMNSNGRLFELVNYIDFFENFPLPQPWEGARSLSEQTGTRELFEAGASLLVDFFSSGTEPTSKCDSKRNSSTHIFEWARLGPETAETFARFKRPFNFLRAFLLINTNKDRLHYLAQSCKSCNNNSPILATVVSDVVGGILQLFKMPPTPVLAYWIETESNSSAKQNNKQI